MARSSPFARSLRSRPVFAVSTLALALSACGGGDGGGSGYTLGGTVSALTTSGLILENGSDTLSVAANANSFTFASTASGSYDVKILSQPAGQTCTVSNGSGSGSSGASVSSVSVACRAYRVFVADTLGNAISQLGVGSNGALSAASPATLASNNQPSSLVVSPDGAHAWAGNVDSEQLSDLLISAGGALSVQASTSAQTFGYALALSPDGSKLYAANYGGASISQFSIGSTGLATALSPATVSTDVAPYALAVTADGQHLYSANSSADTISGYTIGASGALTVLSSGSVSTSARGTNPQGIAVNPGGGYVYVTLADSAKVVAYAVDASSGALSYHASAATGDTPRGIAVTPSGAYAYVVNYGAGTVSQYSLAGGSLTPLSTASIAAGTHPWAIALSPDGAYAYVTNHGDGSVSAYSIGAGGALSAIGTVSVGAGPSGIAVR